jgi:hypothetical protein
MSDAKPLSLPLSAVATSLELDDPIEWVVQKMLAQVAYTHQFSPFINSKACADLIGVSPEHLCATGTLGGQGPPWSGEGKWILRYRRSDVISWLAQLPTISQRTATTATEK